MLCMKLIVKSLKPITGHDEALEKINRNKNTQERKHMKM